MPDASVDAVVCDPPYALTSGKGASGGFMGKEWDARLPDAAIWSECLRVLKPGGHLVAFGGTRTVHRLTCAIEDAGFEIRDSIGWVYFNGFPKSLDVSKAIDEAAGSERTPIMVLTTPGAFGNATTKGSGSAFGEGIGGWRDVSAPATPDAIRWSGWGTALKPSIEPAVLARKPLIGTVAANVLAHGTGALNIDGCRFAPGDLAKDSDGWQGPARAQGSVIDRLNTLGRWPANLYACPKASRGERERGCDGLPVMAGHEAVEREEGSAGLNSPRAGAGRTRGNKDEHHPGTDHGRNPPGGGIRNHHSTVKPVRLMRWLVRLVTPPGGLVIDPFLGSGTTGVAATLEGFRFMGAEREDEYVPIARARIEHAQRHPGAWTDTALGADRKPPVMPVANQPGLFA
jgi:hypothetical protein